MVKVALIQSRVSENRDDNLKNALSLVRKAAHDGAKIICLEELFRERYFPQYEDKTSNPISIDIESLAEDAEGETITAFSRLAEEMHCVVIVPFYECCDADTDTDNENEDDTKGKARYYNSAVVINSDGEVFSPYRKMHIPYDPHFYEKNYFRDGDSFKVFDTTYGKIAVLICYDQWFPESARAAALAGAEIIFYPTAIGMPKELLEEISQNSNDSNSVAEGDWKAAWETVQRGHAISNSLWVAAVNRCGDEDELSFWGGSFICDPFGNVVARAGDEDTILTADVDFDLNADIRSGWGFMRNRRPTEYKALTQPVPERFEKEGFIQPPDKRECTPRKLGYRMPAEWEDQSAVWLSFPYDNGTFEDLDAVEEIYIQLITAIVNENKSGEPEEVHLFVKSNEMRRDVTRSLYDAGCDLRYVTFFLDDYADVWFRDYGPIFVKRYLSERSETCDNSDFSSTAITSWTYNAWGNKYEELLRDNTIPQYIAGLYRMIPDRYFNTGIVLEGGSIDLNGEGLLLTTKQCLLNENRNPELSEGEIEEYLSEYLGVKKVIWLEGGIEGDDTDGHIDDVARFVNRDTVVCSYTDNPDDPNYEILKANYEILVNARDLDDKKLNVVKLPSPYISESYEDEDGETCTETYPASYTNFLITNHAVFVPTFDLSEDAEAISILTDLFPSRKVIGINCLEVVYGSGTIHCISQQEPR